ncbi:hypothetical protein ADN00_00645 [Ornatilinea apprima]|uniref:Uncharacterized protein n=1 Tax=Ornatilinea apprima TaxID=1134406 RepID=A0A0P6YFU2_9CHLR|nr:hypothetical protein ADN00_00645 [Ornatilinea apprima]
MVLGNPSFISDRGSDPKNHRRTRENINFFCLLPYIPGYSRSSIIYCYTAVVIAISLVELSPHYETDIGINSVMDQQNLSFVGPSYSHLQLFLKRFNFLNWNSGVKPSPVQAPIFKVSCLQALAQALSVFQLS